MVEELKRVIKITAKEQSAAFFAKRIACILFLLQPCFSGEREQVPFVNWASKNALTVKQPAHIVRLLLLYSHQE
jgi:hypothetical protein